MSTKSIGMDQSNDLNLMTFIESRIIEILHIENEAKKKKPKLYSQRLPRYMRRRAACHNVKRLPYNIRMKHHVSSSTSRPKKLLKYRRRLSFRKHKRVLQKHKKLNNPKEPFKCLIHKWFAKRFKMGKVEPLIHVPIYNNTKNQRNLYRQSVYGCCFISMIHMIGLKLELNRPTLSEKFMMIDQLEKLNTLTKQSLGFTFCALALEKTLYEVMICLLDGTDKPICNAHVYLSNYDDPEKTPNLMLWVPRSSYHMVLNRLETISSNLCHKPFKVSTLMPKDCVRFRLIGPRSRDEILRLFESDVDTKNQHLNAITQTDERCKRLFKYSIGRYVEGDIADVIYYNTNPRGVDIIFKGSEGRLLWHKLIKHRAHLVGGHRDFQNLVNYTPSSRCQTIT